MRKAKEIVLELGEKWSLHPEQMDTVEEALESYAKEARKEALEEAAQYASNSYTCINECYSNIAGGIRALAERKP